MMALNTSTETSKLRNKEQKYRTRSWLGSFVTVKRPEFSSSHLTEPLMPWRKESIRSQHFIKNDYFFYFGHSTGYSSLVHENHVDFILTFSKFLANCHRDKIISLSYPFSILSAFLRTFHGSSWSDPRKSCRFHIDFPIIFSKLP